MAKEKDDKPGSVFSFAPSESHEERRDDTFTIPAFLRRGAANTKTEAKPQSAPAWKDDDFARIAAKEEAPPGAAETPVPDQGRDKSEPSATTKPESAAPLLPKTPFGDIRPILRDASEKYVSENEAAYQLHGAPRPAATPDILLSPRSEIRIEPKEGASDFERVEPRLSSTEHVGQADQSQRWRLGPALAAGDGDYDDMNMGVSATIWDDEEPAERRSMVRLALLALVVAASGYALAHQLNRPGDMAALWQTSPRDEVAMLSPARPAPLPPANTVAPPPAPVVTAPADQPEAASAPTVPDSKAAITATRSEPPAKATRDEPAPRAEQAHTEPAAPVTLAPGPRALSASSTARSSSSVTASGELVLDIQQRLTALGYANVPLDGQLGTNTRSAIMAFQRNSGLPMTGSIDPELLSRLRQTSPVAMRLVKGPDAITPR